MKSEYMRGWLVMNLEKYNGVLLPSGKINPFVVRDIKTGRFISVKKLRGVR